MVNGQSLNLFCSNAYVVLINVLNFQKDVYKLLPYVYTCFHFVIPRSSEVFIQTIRICYVGNKVMRAYKETLIKENDDNFSSRQR